jgi:hypothetical protein
MRLSQPEVFMVVLLGVEMLQAELPVFENSMLKIPSLFGM